VLIGDHFDRHVGDRPAVPLRTRDDAWSAARRAMGRAAARFDATARAHARPRGTDAVAEYLVIAAVLVVSLMLIAGSAYLGSTVLSWTRSEDVAAEALALRDLAVEGGVACDGWVPGKTVVVLGVMNSAEGRCNVPDTGVALRFEAYARSYLDGDNQAGFPPGSTGDCPWLEAPGYLVHPVMAERVERQQWTSGTETVRVDTMTAVQATLGGTLHPC
jgi:hypothetical protein